MRKFILITAMVLVSVTAQAQTRSLTLASNDEPVAAEPQKPVETPKNVERPPAVDTKTETPKSEPASPGIEKKADVPKTEAVRTEKPKRRHLSTEARVINELHRHGIYW
jgi:outer membrane biosynthesis protein TonB